MFDLLELGSLPLRRLGSDDDDLGSLLAETPVKQRPELREITCKQASKALCPKGMVLKFALQVSCKFRPDPLHQHPLP